MAPPTMKILFLAPRPPWPLDTGGKIRTYHLLRGLAAAHDLTACLFCESDEEWQVAEQLRPMCSAVHRVRRNLHGLNLAADLARGLVGRLPFTVRKYVRRAMAGEVRRLLAGQRFDLVHCDHLHMAPYGALCQGLCWTFDDHNIESVILRRYATSARGRLRRLAFAQQYLLMRAFERRAAQGASATLVCSDVDRATMLRLAPRARVRVVPNGVDLSRFAADGDERSTALAGDARFASGAPGRDAASPYLVFTGSMDWAPNDEAACWFVRQALPEVRQALPGIRLVVVGRNPSPALRQLAERDGGTRLTGLVDDVRPYLASALALVVPIHVGGGTRLKILEAMAARVPVVSTAVGAEGIAARDGEEILLAESPADFARQLRRLGDEAGLAARLSENGRALVEGRYGWEAIGRQLAVFYASSCRPRRVSARLRQRT